MSRMLAALKAIESRKASEPPASNSYLDLPPLRDIQWPESLPALVAEAAGDSDAHTALQPAELPVPALTSMGADGAAYEALRLNLSQEVPRHYAEMAARIGQQMSSNYCNVLLFASADSNSEPAFSMTELAHAFAWQSSGNVLLIDGDLRRGRLSRSVGALGIGMIEVMLGTTPWSSVIHPTNSGRIDFVARGCGQVPTLERPEFGWGAMRPQYTAVLIGLAAAEEPETAWLAARCDGVYLLLSRGRTKRRAAGESVTTLRSSGANVLGCVVADG